MPISFGAIALVAALPAVARAQAPAPRTTPTPIPVASPTALPYPAYGTPEPGVAQEVPQSGVPSQVSLPQAVAIAAARSPILAVARADFRLTQIPLELARTAVFPNLSGTASITRSGGGNRTSNSGSNGSSNNASNSGSFGSSGFTSSGANLQLRQLIYDGGRVVAQIRQAQANELAGAGTYERQLQTLSFNVAQAYYTALQAESGTQLASQVVRQNEVQERLVSAQLRAGTVSRVDLATAQLPTAQARVALVRAQGTELTALAAFANTLGLNADAEVAPRNDTPSNPTVSQVAAISYDQALQRALALRPDFTASEEAVRAAQYNVRVQKLGLFPTLNGTASYGVNSTTQNGAVFRSSNSIGAVLTIPIFDQGITRAQTQQALAQLAVAQGQLDETRLGIQLNVRQALIDLVSAQAAVSQAQAELAKAQEILRATQAQYSAGVTTLPLLLNAQVGLTQAQSDQLTAVYGLRQAEQTYLYALGESDLTLGV